MVLLLQVGQWYKRQSPAPVKARMAGGAAEHAVADDERRLRRGDSRRADVLQERLYGEPQLLLHLLPDREILRSRCRSLRCCCSCSWSPRRWDTLIGGHLGDRFGRREIIWFSILGAVPFTLCLAVRQPVLTAVLTDRHRHDHGERLPGHPGLCAGAAAGQSRHDRRTVLRGLVRSRRARAQR